MVLLMGESRLAPACLSCPTCHPIRGLKVFCSQRMASMEDLWIWWERWLPVQVFQFPFHCHIGQAIRHFIGFPADVSCNDADLWLEKLAKIFEQELESPAWRSFV